MVLKDQSLGNDEQKVCGVDFLQLEYGNTAQQQTLNTYQLDVCRQPVCR